jgi:hypothetical protein
MVKPDGEGFGVVEAMPRLPDSITVPTGILVESATSISRIAYVGLHPAAFADRLFDGNADIRDGYWRCLGGSLDSYTATVFRTMV